MQQRQKLQTEELFGAARAGPGSLACARVRDDGGGEAERNSLPDACRVGTCMFKKPESVEAERVFGRGGRPFRMGDRGRLVL